MADQVVHDFPLRPDLFARLVLPRTLTTADADRLCTFIRALAFDDAHIRSLTQPSTEEKRAGADG